MFYPVSSEPRTDPAFLRCLQPFDTAALDEDPCVIYGATQDFGLAYVNRAFTASWRQNGGSAEGWGGLGASLLDAIRGRLRGFYERKFREALARQEPWLHTYPCASLGERRLYQMRVLPVARTGWLVLHSVVAEVPGPARGEEEYARLVPEDYRNEQGLLLQCSNCRRVRRARSCPPRWDWVPAFAHHPPTCTSHGICRACIGFYYPDYARRRE